MDFHSILTYNTCRKEVTYMDEYLKTLGNNIKSFRLLNGWTQEELATKCGYTSDNRKSAIHKIESGKSNLPASKLAVFARVFGVAPSDLFTGIPVDYEVFTDDEKYLIEISRNDRLHERLLAYAKKLADLDKLENE